MRYFEDLKVGNKFTTAEYGMTVMLLVARRPSSAKAMADKSEGRPAG